MQDTPATPASQIVFEQFQQPGLKYGKYTITATLTVNDPDPQTYPSLIKHVQVGGDAASIPGDAVVEVFPTENANGDYRGHLAHVLLKYPTLPWREVMDGAGEATPWLAVLLLTDAELASQQSPGAPADTLQLDPEFFRAIAPRLEDLAWLAHVRKVDTAAKADSDAAEIEYALVVGNRLPTPGMNANAYLVSLAGLGGVLAGDAPPGPKVKVPVFYSWCFFCTKESRTFADVMDALDRDPPTLGLPYDAQAADSGNDLLAMGYVPMPHALRVGGRTVSWYRGPLVPYGSARDIPKAMLPVASADAVTFYDPTVGMMDMSCAAA